MQIQLFMINENILLHADGYNPFPIRQVTEVEPTGKWQIANNGILYMEVQYKVVSRKVNPWWRFFKYDYFL